MIKYEDFVKDRITELRLKEDISEYTLSKRLGHSKSYIYNISSGRALPPLKGFFEICRYFKLSPKEFFDTDTDDPQIVSEATEAFKQLPPEDQQTILNLIKSLLNKNK